jgi:hypothetical protein
LEEQGIGEINELSLVRNYVSGTPFCLAKERDGYQNINTFYSKLSSINLNGTKFNYFGEKVYDFARTGAYTFGSTTEGLACDFSNVRKFVLAGADFSPEKNIIFNTAISTGHYTFANANFLRLKDLYLSECTFSSQSMGINATIKTGDHTFSGTKFGKYVRAFDVYNLRFATPGMGNDHSDIYTASYTFSKTDFSHITSCAINSIKFADQNMSVEGSVVTADHTFSETDFSSLKSLGLNNFFTVAASDMQTTSSPNTFIKTASFTFAQANFSALESLNLSGATFISENAIGSAYDDTNLTTNLHEIFSADNTFSGCEFFALTDLNLSGTKFAFNNMSKFLKPYDIYTGYQTFNHSNFQLLTKIDLSNTIFTNVCAVDDVIVAGDRTFVNTTISSLNLVNITNVLYGSLTNGLNSISEYALAGINKTWSPENKIGVAYDANNFTSTEIFDT